MNSHELSPSELEDTLQILGVSSFDEGLIMNGNNWDMVIGTVLDENNCMDDLDDWGEDRSYLRHVFQLDGSLGKKIFPNDQFTPMDYELPFDQVAYLESDEYVDSKYHDEVEALYQYMENSPFFASRINRSTGVPTNIQLLDFVSASEHEAVRNHTIMTVAFDKFASFLGLKAPNAEDASSIDNLNGIDIFLIPANQQTEELGIFKRSDSTLLGGYAFVQANGRFAMAIRDSASNRHTTAHEFGHILDFIANGVDIVTEEIPDNIMQSAVINEEHITLYGKTHDSELFADAFCIASLRLMVKEVEQNNGTKNIEISRPTSATELLHAAIFGEGKIDGFSKDIHVKYHNLFRLMLKKSMPNVSNAIQKNKKRVAASKSH